MPNIERARQPGLADLRSPPAPLRASARSTIATALRENQHVIDLLKDRTIVISGAAGSVGKALVSTVLGFEPRELRLFDNNETELFFLEEGHRGSPISAVLGDVRDRETLVGAFKEADIVFHLAALKHVPLCERNPLEAVQTNIVGVQNVTAAAIEVGVPHVLCTSSDKAVNPTSVMGASKLMGERLVAAANIVKQKGQIFVCTRFGNVLGSRGSVMPIFCEQIRRGGPVTLTDTDMTRFIMTLAESVDLILESASLARGGEVFITKMRAVRIVDLARAMIAELAPEFGVDPARIEIKITGQRPGEKIYEELMTSEETRRSIEFDRHFAVLPALSDLYGKAAARNYPDVMSDVVEQPYTSKTAIPLSVEQIREYLRANGVFAEVLGQ
jgi:FlaA1/EpsC-like NDP-sugar epimerase